MYHIKINPIAHRAFYKLEKKNPKQLKIVYKKVKEILKNPCRYKNLRFPLNRLKRVHIDKHFVLIFSIDETTKTVTLEDYNHHDDIYKESIQ